MRNHLKISSTAVLILAFNGCATQSTRFVTLANNSNQELGYGPDMFGMLRSNGVRIESDGNGDVRIYDSPACRKVLVQFRRIQVKRMDVIAENVLNTNTVAGQDGRNTPYRRKFLVMGVDGSTHIETDPSPFQKRDEPKNPLADANGYVRYPNVDMATEQVNIKQADEQYRMASAILAKFDPTYIDDAAMRMNR